ncbi:hypothetical protein R3P38DRAFT_3146170 [Favolaschia claudopus]|uniref:F-box domain-containing protein n=1 Tax=Favolaschia claudopus TaxID=2862362 RepID=A0AAV9Z4R4_9AGAR
MDPQDPLDIQELLDRIIGCLAYSTPSLLACSMVARSWAHPAQANLFRAPNFTTRDLTINLASSDVGLMKIYDILTYSPHLVPLVRDISLAAEWLQYETVERICSIAFTQLHTLWLDLPLHAPTRLLLQSFLGRIPLSRLSLMVWSGYQADYAAFLRSCPPIVRHLELAVESLPTAVHATQRHGIDQRSVITLKSLQWNWLGIDTLASAEDLDSIIYPFDVSQIEALSVHGYKAEFLRWSALPVSLIRILDLNIEHRDDWSTLNLSPFSNLRMLRICYMSPLSAPVVDTLKSLKHHQPLHTIVISMYYSQNHRLQYSNEYMELDSVLSTLTLDTLSTFELEQRRGWNPRVSEFFPLSIARGMFTTLYRSEELVIERWRELIDGL